MVNYEDPLEHYYSRSISQAAPVFLLSSRYLSCKSRPLFFLLKTRPQNIDSGFPWRLFSLVAVTTRPIYRWAETIKLVTHGETIMPRT